MKKTIHILTVAAILVMLAGCAGTPFAPIGIPDQYAVKPNAVVSEKDVNNELELLQRIEPEPYRISSGDQFNFSVYEHPELAMTDAIVTPDGYISLPLLGPQKIGGMNLIDANAMLQKAASKYIRNPLVSLIPYKINGFNYTILGRVNYPGSYPLAVGTTRLIDAVAQARGLAQGLFHGDTVELADLENAYIVRKGKILPVDFKKALLQGDALNNIPLKNGDYIYIPSTMNSTVILLGEIVAPTYVGFKEGMSILQALPFGKGLKETYSSEIRIIRGGMKNPVVYTVNLTQIMEGKAMDFPLQANDIIYIPPDGLSDWNIMVRKIIPTLQGLSMLAGPFGNSSFLLSN